MGDNVAAVQSIYDAFAKGDVPGVLAAMDPKIDWQEPATLPFENQTGPDNVAQNIFGRIFELFESFAVQADEIADAGDAVFATGRYTGKSKAGNALDAEFVHHWRFGSDGKVTYFRTYTDTKLWLDSIG